MKDELRRGESFSPEDTQPFVGFTDGFNCWHIGCFLLTSEPHKHRGVITLQRPMLHTPKCMECGVPVDGRKRGK